ncbi:hypothetical protein J437_LFUL007236 [Ladona fulva]|uniref:Uncharacterized protein n=1 Tax=Ladona fulva TaxID=123851 RepID=A0A8K0NZQ7_LADFU|nr:hypothetical protein J437_LFUL007236 [Ladona fulva]
MEKAAFLHIGLLLCLMLGINFMAEARSLIPKYVANIEIQEEVEPTIIFIENEQHDKTHKLEKHIAKMDKKLKKLNTSYKQQLKDIEILSNILAKLISKTYITNDETQLFTEKMQMKIQEIERNMENLKRRHFQSEEIEESKSAENIPEEVESSLGMFEDSDQDDTASARAWNKIMLLPFWFNIEEKSKSIDSVEIGDFENDHQSVMPEFKPEIDDDEMHKNTYNWLFSSEEEE